MHAYDSVVIVMVLFLVRYCSNMNGYMYIQRCVLKQRQMVLIFIQVIKLLVTGIYSVAIGESLITNESP